MHNAPFKDVVAKLRNLDIDALGSSSEGSHVKSTEVSRPHDRAIECQVTMLPLSLNCMYCSSSASSHYPRSKMEETIFANFVLSWTAWVAWGGEFLCCIVCVSSCKIVIDSVASMSILHLAEEGSDFSSYWGIDNELLIQGSLSKQHTIGFHYFKMKQCSTLRAIEGQW